MRIAITGASGLVGGLLLPRLSEHEVTLVGRRAVEGAASNITQRVGDMAEWPALLSGESFDAAICCLGTTIRIAGSQPAFAAVDRDAVIAFAEAARRGGARHFLLVTAVGSNAGSSNFYLRTKGEAEAGVKATGYDRIDIFRPGLLRGDRKGPRRPGEGLFTALSPITDLLTPAVFDKYRSIAAEDVARAMAACVTETAAGVHVHENRDMLHLGAGIG